MIEVSIVRFIKILRQDLSNIFHNPTLIFSNTILPLVLIGVLGFITKSGFGDTPVNSFDYYGINMMIFSYMVNNSSSRKRYASPKAGTELYLDLVFRQ